MIEDRVFGYTQDLEPITDIEAFAEAIKDPARVVGRDEFMIYGGVVSVWTTHLVCDYRFGPEGPPLIYETLVQCSKGVPPAFAGIDSTIARYATRPEAQAGHQEMLSKIGIMLAGSRCDQR